jgi:hypothetical protein
MDIKMYNTAKALAEGYVMERNLCNKKIDPKNPQHFHVKAAGKLSPEEQAVMDARFAEMDRRFAEANEQTIKATGIDPRTIPFKFERPPPMTKEEGEAYVQGVLDDMVKTDARIQKMRQMEQQWLSGGLHRVTQGSQVDTSA